MTRTQAKKIALIITNEQIQEMLYNAKTNIKDWTKVSIVNKGFTKGTSWNVLAKDFDINKTYHDLTKINMVREFGDFLPEDMKIKKQIKNHTIPIHQDPQF